MDAYRVINRALTKDTIVKFRLFKQACSTQVFIAPNSRLSSSVTECKTHNTPYRQVSYYCTGIRTGIRTRIAVAMSMMGYSLSGARFPDVFVLA